MLIPKFIDAKDAADRGVQEGWWSTAESGEAISGPYPTREAAMIAIAKHGGSQPTGRPGGAPPRPQ